jgi:hypothetical protein
MKPAIAKIQVKILYDAAMTGVPTRFSWQGPPPTSAGILLMRRLAAGDGASSAPLGCRLIGVVKSCHPEVADFLRTTQYQFGRTLASENVETRTMRYEISRSPES